MDDVFRRGAARFAFGKLVFRACMPLRCCLAPPCNRLLRVIKPAIPAAVTVAQLELCIRIAVIALSFQLDAGGIVV